MTQKNHFQVIRRTQVVATDSIATLKPGEEVTISCVDFAPMQTVNSAICRLNARAKRKEYACSSPDNGATIIIKRLTHG